MTILSLLLLLTYQAAEPLSGTLTESFGEPKVSGSVVVGAAIGADARWPDALISIPDGEGAGFVCIRAVTRDGLYRASFEAHRPPGGRYSVDPQPSFNFSQQLGGYDVGDIAVLTRVGTSCAGGETVIAPVMSSSGGQALLLHINSQRAISLSSEVAGLKGENIVGACEVASSRQRVTAYNATCMFDIESLPRDQVLDVDIVRRLRSGTATERVKVWVPK